MESPSSGSHQSRSSPTGFFWMPSCQCCRDDPVFLKPFIHHPHTVHSFGSTIPPSKDVPQFMDHLGTSGPVFQGRRKHSQDVMGECRNPDDSWLYHLSYLIVYISPCSFHYHSHIRDYYSHLPAVNYRSLFSKTQNPVSVLLEYDFPISQVRYILPGI